MRHWLWLVLALPSIGNAIIVSPKSDAASVTIYRSSEEGNPDLADPDSEAEGFALISETRELELPVGESDIEFVGVAETIVPQSARLESFPGVVAETNFDYKLISPGELINNSIGQYVRLVRTDTDNGKVNEQRARLVSGPDGVLLDIDGKIESLDCSGAPEKLVFDSVPENLRSKPVLSARIRVNNAGRHVVRLSYLATGFDWSANYVARINPDRKTLNLTGWVTLANKQDISFNDAPVQVIAGNIVRDQSTSPVDIVNLKYQNKCWPIGKWYDLIPVRSFGAGISNVGYVDSISSQDVGKFPDANITEMLMRIPGVTITTQRNLGDYKLYELPSKTDLSAQQVKQVMMTYHQRVSFEKIYTLTMDRYSDNTRMGKSVYPAHTLLRMQNKTERGLGKPLPAGNVVVMERYRNQFIVAGINNIKDVPVDLPVEVELGEAFDVQVEVKKITERSEQEGSFKYMVTEMEADLINRKSLPIQFEFRQEVENGNISIVNEATKHIMHKGLPTWVVRIPARSQRTIRYTLRKAQ